MTHVVYHQTLLCEVVKDEDYLNYLETGEWFDRPQNENIKGNSDETKQLLSRRSKGSESGSLGCDKNGEQVLRNSDVQERVHQSENDGSERRPEESGTKIEVIIDKAKKRGRPPKIAS